MLERKPVVVFDVYAPLGSRVAEIIFAAAFFAVLLLPLGGQYLVGPVFGWFDLVGAGTSENRTLAALPPIPQSLAELEDLPGKLNPYIADRFGMRSAMIGLSNRLRFELFDEMPTQQTIFGPTGRLFFTSHSANAPFSLIRNICGIGVTDANVDSAAQSIEQLVKSMEQRHLNGIVALIPTAPIIYRKDLPHWLAKRCQGPSTVDRIMKRLQQLGEAGRVLYPLSPMRAAARSELGAFPTFNFHWNGNGPRFTAEYLAGQVLGRTNVLSMPPKVQPMPADLSGFAEGIPFKAIDVFPDISGTEAYLCRGPACFPELGAKSAILFDVTRAGSPASNKRLLVLSDSFGHMIAPWFAEYYGSVWQIGVANILDKLSNKERSAFLDLVFATYAPDDVILLFHDGGALNLGSVSSLLFGPTQPMQPLGLSPF